MKHVVRVPMLARSGLAANVIVKQERARKGLTDPKRGR